MMDIQSIFGPPRQLQDFQVERLRRLQESFLVMAKAIIDNTPNVPDREKALEALRNAKTLADSAARIHRSIVTVDTLADLFKPTELRNTRVTRAWFNVVDYADVRKFGRDIIDPECDVARLKQGIQGRIWNVEIRTSRKVPEGLAMIVGEDQGDSDLEMFAKDSDLKLSPEQLIHI